MVLKKGDIVECIPGKEIYNDYWNLNSFVEAIVIQPSFSDKFVLVNGLKGQILDSSGRKDSSHEKWRIHSHRLRVKLNLNSDIWF